MAIDTKAKRASVAYRMLPPPDSTINAQDRGHVAQIYAGITFGAPVVSDIIRRRVAKLFGTFFGRR